MIYKLDFCFGYMLGSCCPIWGTKPSSFLLKVQVIFMQVPVGKLHQLSQAPEQLAGSKRINKNCNILHLYRILGIFSANTILKAVPWARAGADRVCNLYSLFYTQSIWESTNSHETIKGWMCGYSYMVATLPHFLPTCLSQNSWWIFKLDLLHFFSRQYWERTFWDFD